MAVTFGMDVKASGVDWPEVMDGGLFEGRLARVPTVDGGGLTSKLGFRSKCRWQISKIHQPKSDRITRNINVIAKARGFTREPSVLLSPSLITTAPIMLFRVAPFNTIYTELEIF